MGIIESAYGFYLDKGILGLEQELDGTLSNIAFADSSGDLKYIHNARRRIRRKYGQLIDELKGIDYSDHCNAVLFAFACIRDASIDFIGTNWDKMNINEREEYAMNILGDYNFLGEGEGIPLAMELDRFSDECVDIDKVGYTLYPGGDYEIDITP